METKRNKIFRVGDLRLPIPVPRPAPMSERAAKRAEMLKQGMMPIPVGLETATRESLAKIGIVNVQYSPVYNERYVPASVHRHE